MTINDVKGILKERANLHLEMRNSYKQDSSNRYFHDGAQIALLSALQTIEVKLSKEKQELGGI